MAKKPPEQKPGLDGLQQLVTADSHVAGDAAGDTAGMNIEYWPTGQPIPYEKNARKLSARALEVVAASLKEFGWRQPIVVDKHGVIVAGH